MDQLEQLITANKIPIGLWAKQVADWLTGNFEWVFDSITAILKVPMEGTVDALLLIPSVVFILLMAALAYFLQRSWRLVAFVVIGFLFVLNQGLWKDMIETLVLILYATAVSLVLGIIIGIAASRRPWIYQLLSPILDMMQTIPTFVYLVPMLVLFGLGIVPGMISTVIFAIPAPIRLTYLGLSEVSKALVEAGESFGCSRWQLLTKVKLPAALPTIMAGVNQCIMLSLSMVVIAALIGAGGLGKPVVRSLNQVNIPLGVESGLAIVILAIILDRMLRQRQRRAAGGKSGKA
jgi:glycine betaine/proline transport system permease protein